MLPTAGLGRSGDRDLAAIEGGRHAAVRLEVDVDVEVDDEPEGDVPPEADAADPFGGDRRTAGDPGLRGPAPSPCRPRILRLYVAVSVVVPWAAVIVWVVAPASDQPVR